MWECLQRLPADERALVLDYYYEGRTDAQLGHDLYDDGSPQARGLRARRVRLRALARLRRLLLEHDGFAPPPLPKPGRIATALAAQPPARRRSACRRRGAAAQ